MRLFSLSFLPMVLVLGTALCEPPAENHDGGEVDGGDDAGDLESVIHDGDTCFQPGDLDCQDVSAFYCDPGSNQWVTAVNCTEQCDHVEDDPTVVQCDNATEYAVLGGRCTFDGSGACDTDNVLMKCQSSLWTQYVDCKSTSTTCALYMDDAGTHIGCR